QSVDEGSEDVEHLVCCDLRVFCPGSPRQRENGQIVSSDVVFHVAPFVVVSTSSIAVEASQTKQSRVSEAGVLVRHREHLREVHIVHVELGNVGVLQVHDLLGALLSVGVNERGVGYDAELLNALDVLGGRDEVERLNLRVLGVGSLLIDGGHLATFNLDAEVAGAGGSLFSNLLRGLGLGGFALLGSLLLGLLLLCLLNPLFCLSHLLLKLRAPGQSDDRGNCDGRGCKELLHGLHLSVVFFVVDTTLTAAEAPCQAQTQKYPAPKWERGIVAGQDSSGSSGTGSHSVPDQ